ncbi:hypothetical protein C9374_010030 [Naegleria lovaniensis]|uniref:Glycoside hydrolase family 44 catalytic domain-containing protein n=1 Tax=Naegleria lovaniensis TaxID=51637 RepID=A0AA88GEF0_NAELO|nr:uncharacterized protein C9374_010030 [Naegleria lovaniensis]KAG2375026.1 hypothetical protein C9374_010030 [Naegleria lovaniensis]
MTTFTSSKIFIPTMMIILFLTNYIHSVNIQVDLTQRSGRVINPDIFGVNHASASHLSSVAYTVNRKGGNSETRYNWEKGIHNTARDWYYMNIVDDVSNVNALPEGTAATRFIDESNTYKSKIMLTSSMIGFTPKDTRQKLWSFSVSKYGAQQETECTQGDSSWCQPDAGNGVKTDGSTFITGNNPFDTSKVINESYTTKWMNFLQQRGTPVKLWSLDNEMDLWHSTHRDVHPQKVSYDEIWNLTRIYASAIKQQDSSVKIFGYSAWGWCSYYFSPLDGCSNGADRQAHSNLPLVAFYLKQLCDYEKLHSKRLVDYLDIHYYPQADGVYNPQQTSDIFSALRLRTVRSLYDFSYQDESWISQAAPTVDDQKVALIPRMKNYISQYCPWVKLAITEYNFGADGLWSSALAQLEILSIFGREGVDLATRWTVPNVGSVTERAFKFYLNFDGKGSKVGGESVRALSDATLEMVTSYAFHENSTRNLYLIVVNKMTSSQTINLNLKGMNFTSTRTLIMYTFSQSQSQIVNARNITANVNGQASFSMEALSAELIVVTTDSTGPSPKPNISPSPKPRASSNNNNRQGSTKTNHAPSNAKIGLLEWSILFIILFHLLL